MNTDDTIIRQYEIYAQALHSLVEGRGKANKYYFAVISALSASIGFFFERLSEATFAISLLSAIGALVGILWFWFILSYRSVLKRKITVLEKLEIDMPIKPFTEESTIVKKRGPFSKFLAMTNAEMAVSVLSFAGFLIILWWINH